jgi:hypothetical protein
MASLVFLLQDLKKICFGVWKLLNERFLKICKSFWLEGNVRLITCIMKLIVRLLFLCMHEILIIEGFPNWQNMHLSFF